MDTSALFGFDASSLWSKNSRQKRKYGTGLSTGTNLPEDISTALGAAETSYIKGDYSHAIELLSEVTKKAPRLAEPYSILALIYEETGDRKHALQLYALAAAFSKRNLELWRKVLLLSIQMGEYQQASVALLRCYSLSSTAEQDFGHVRIVLTAMLGQYRELHAMIKFHMTRNPEDVALLVKVIDLMIDMGYNVRGIKYATQYLAHWYINDHDSRVNIQLTEDQADELIYNLVSITFVVRSLVMLYIDRLKLVEAQKILENSFLVFNVAFRTCSMRDESFTFPHELSLLLGYLTLRLGVAKEDEVTIDRGLQILQPIIATVVNNPNLLLDPVFPSSTDSSTLNSEATTQINMQELETTVSTLHVLLLVAKKMSDLNMKMRSMKIMDFILDVFRSLLNKASYAVKSSVVCQVAKYFQILQRHEEVVELAESAIAGDLFSSETIHLYAVEVMDHAPEKLSQVEVTTSLYLRLLLDEGVRIRKLMMGSRGSKMFGGDEEDDEEEELEGEEEENEEEENDGNSEDEKPTDEELNAKKKTTKVKRSKTKPGRRGKKTFDEEDAGDDHGLSLSSLNNPDFSQEPIVASLPIVQEMDVDEEENEDEEEMDRDDVEDEAVPMEAVSEEDFTQDIDMFMEECETNNALNNATVPREDHLNATETNSSSLSMGAVASGPVPFNSSSSSSSSKMLFSDSFLGIADPIFQKSFPLVNLTRQNSAASVEASATATNAHGSAEDVSSSPMSDGTHPVTAVVAAVTEDKAPSGLFSFLVSNVTASLFPKDSMPLKLLLNYHANHANDQSASPAAAAESHNKVSQNMWEFFTPLHARHSFHRRILHDILQVICTHAIVLAKQVENHQSSSSLKGDLDLLPVLTLTLLQAYSRVLSRRLKTRETVRMKLFMTQWQTQETSVAQSASTLLWKELHYQQYPTAMTTSSTSNVNETVDVRLQEKISLAALIHTLCDYIPLETIVDKDYFDVLLPEVMSQFNALTVSESTTQETLSRQRDLFVQQAMALSRVDETLQQRRRHRSGWLSVHGPAMMTTVSLDNQQHGTADQAEALLSQQPGVPRVQQRRTLFNQETWLQTASMISPEVRQAASRLWEQPDDVNTANHMFRLLVEEAYHVSPAASIHKTTQGMELEKAFVSSEIYLENRLPIRTLVLEIPEANARSGLAHFLAGHEVALVRKHLEAVDSYLNAFLLSPDEPLISLTLAGYFLFLSTHPLFRARYDNMLRALCFLINYQKLRRRCPLPPSPVEALFATNGKNNGHADNMAPKYLQFLKEVTTYQETLYNLGRAFHDMKLHHLAVVNYRKVLQLYDEHLSSPAIAAAIHQEVAAVQSKITGVTREAAHNLVLLYRHSQAKDLALSIMLKYLRF